MSFRKPQRPLRGIVPPIVTPLTGEGDVDLPALRRILDHVLSGGVHGLFVLGTTGEGPSLAYRVRTALVEAACEFAAGRAPVLVGVTDTALSESIDMAFAAAEAGADAVVFAPPCYFPIDQPDLEAAARRLARESPLPVMLYNMPALTKSVFEPDTVARLLDEPKLIGLKDSSGDLEYFVRMRSVIDRRADWSLMAGPEHLLAETVAAGGDGGVCGGANLFPELFVRLFEASAAGIHETVARLHGVVRQLEALYRLGTNPALSTIQGIKAGLAEKGLCSPRLCAPFSGLGDREAPAVGRILLEVEAALACEPAPQPNPLFSDRSTAGTPLGSP